MKRPEGMSASAIAQELDQLRRRIDELDSTGHPTGWLTARIVALNQELERRAHGGQTNTPRSVAKGLFAQMRRHVADQPSYESNGAALARTLLEADDEDIKNYLLTHGEDARLPAIPAGFRPFLDAMPEATRDEFLNAYGRPDGYAEYENGSGIPVVGEGWPTSDGDNVDPATRWMEVHYSVVFRIDGGRLYVGVEVNTGGGGDAEMVDMVPWGTASHRRIRREFGLKARYESLQNYYASVAESGLDPLGYVVSLPSERHATKWRVGIRAENDRPKFWKARKIRSQPPDRTVIDDPAELPQAVRDYLYLDENGFLADFQNMAEFVAVPDVKAVRGYWQVEFETEDKRRNEAENQQHIQREAARFAREYSEQAALTDPDEALVVP